MYKFHYDLKGVYDAWLASGDKRAIPNRQALDKSLLDFLTKVMPDFILMDWGFSIIVPGDTSANPTWFSLYTPQAVALKCSAPDLIFSNHNKSAVIPIGSYLSALPVASRPDVLIYTYNPFDAYVFEDLTSVQDRFAESFGNKENDGKGPVMHYVETSAFFNHPKALALYKGWNSQEIEDGLREIGTEKQLVQYGIFLSVAFRDYLRERMARNINVDPTRIFDIENLRFIRYKRFVSDKLGHISFGGGQLAGRSMHLRLGALTYYYAPGDPLMDIPRKDYYPALDAFAKEVGLGRVLNALEPGTAFWDQGAKNFLYVRLFPRRSNIPERARSGLLDLAIETHHSNVNFGDKQLKQLVSLLFSSIYYHCDTDEEGAWKPGYSQVFMRQGVALRKWRERDGLGSNKLSPIDLFYFCQKVETDGGQTGWINYTLYSDDEEAVPLSIKQIEEIRDRVLFDIRPVVIAKAKDALLPRLIGEVERHARSASLSQVLTRTMSHNLGSHSLNAFATEDGMCMQFERVEALIAKKTLLPGHIVGVDSAPLDLSDLSKHRRELLARYNNYLRERMDFLADITTAVPAFETRTHFVQDLLKGFADNHLLTTTIAGSPDFDYQWKVMRDGKELRDKDDILVSIPSDVLGRHAFYVILENIVRNSSKHGAHPKGEPVTYSVEVTQMTGKHADMLKVTIKDNKCRPTRENTKDPITYCDEHESLSTDEKQRIESVQELTGKRNADINRPVLENGRVREGAWGMLEMKACAAYLRRLALEDLDDAKYHAFIPDPKATEEVNAERVSEHRSQSELPLLEAEGDAGGFGYAFYLLRPKEVMVIGEKVEELFPGLDANDKERLPEHGIGLMGLAELVKRPVINHGLLVYHKTTDEGLRSFIKHLLEDPNAMPHEILIAGATKEAVDAAMDQVSKNEAFAPDHVVIAKRSTSPIESLMDPPASADTIAAWIYRVRQEWLKGRYKMSCTLIDTIKTKLCESPTIEEIQNNCSPADPLTSITADYAVHAGDNRFYVEVQEHTDRDLGRDGLEKDMVADIDPAMLSMHLDKRRARILRYPSALEHVMEAPDGNSVHDRLSTQHHLAYWLDDTAVIDERIQAAVHVDTYSPEVKSEDMKETIRVKHLMDLAGVMIPHSRLNLHEQVFSPDLFKRLVDWLAERSTMLSYVYIHLSILEKFEAANVMKLQAALDHLKSKLPATRIIVISGRGKPHNLPDGALFVSYSAVSQYLTQRFQRSPVLLHRLSRSARRLIKKA